MGFKKLLTVAALLVAGGLAHSAWGQNIGDIIVDGTTKYEVIGENLITNGSFDDGVSGWYTANGKSATAWIDANSSNFTITNSGGFDNGAYITVNGAGTASVKTLRNRIPVEAGKTYMLRCFTSGKTPGYDNIGYNGLWASADGYTEVEQLYVLEWGAACAQTTTSWTENTFVFTATEANPFVCLRFGWNASTNLDGFFLGEVKAGDTFNQTVSLGDWTTNNCGTGSKQHWDGNEGTTYFDNWNGSSASHQISQKITLPAGEYVLKAAGRAQATNNSSTYISVDDKKIYFRSKGDTGFGIDTNGNENFSSSGTYANNNAGRGWEWRYIHFTLTEQKEVTIGGGYSINNSWAGLCTPELFTDETAKKQVVLNEISSLNSVGSELISSKMDASVKSTLETELEKSFTTSNSLSELYEAKTTLQTAVDNAKSSIALYAKIKAYIDNAKTFGITVATYESAYNEGAYTEVTGETARQKLNVTIYNTASQVFTNEFVLTGWTGEIKTASGQHWDGIAGTSYYDTNGTNITRTLSKTATLPAGTFVFKAAGRSAVAATMSLDVNGQTVLFNAKGDSGYGIDKTGKANFSESSDTIYANENKGRGWEWEFVKFTLAEETEVTLTAKITTSGWAWGSFANVSLWMDDATYQNMLFNAAKDELTATLNSASSLNTTINVGTDPFQIPSSEATKLTNAVTTATTALNADDATKESLEEVNTVLKSAIDAYKNVELNAPDENIRYAIQSVANWIDFTRDNKDWDYLQDTYYTYLPNDRSGQGDYNIKLGYAKNSNYGQAFAFEAVDSIVNGYKIYQTDGDGNNRYISTGVPYGGNTAQIRTTTESEDALVFVIIPTDKDGVYNLYNTENKTTISPQDAGMYCSSYDMDDVKLVEAAKATVDLNIAVGKYATRIFPFAVAAEDIPAGITVKSLSEVNGEKLILNDETAIAPNVPYILYSEEGIETTLTGYGTAKQDTYETDFLTGVYGEGTVPVGSYVLQTQGGVQGFYKVVDEPVEYVPYRAYLKGSGANAKAFFFGGDATAINGVEGAEGATEVVRYNAAGVKVSAPVKGLNIVKMSDGTVKKVMVK